MKDLTEANAKIETLNSTIDTLKFALDETNTTMKDSTKYLINLDRNTIKHNVMLFGLPEDDTLEITLKKEENEEDAGTEYASNDKDKVKLILKSIGYNGEI